MPSRWSLIALGIGAYFAFTLASFPAATAYRWFAPDAIRLAGIEGTVWSGQAAIGSVAELPFTDVRWHVRPLPLLIGRMSADLQTRLADGFVNAHVSATPSVVEIGGLKASTSLPTLAAVLPTRGMQGLVSARFSRLRLEDGWPTAAVGSLRLAQLQVAPLLATDTQQSVALGNYEMTFADSTSAGGIAATFKDTGGPLEVTGTLTLDAMRAYKLDALVKPRSDASEPLLQGLSIMTADPDAPGRRRLTLTGSALSAAGPASSDHVRSSPSSG